MMRSVIVLFFWLLLSVTFAAESEKKLKNKCIKAVNQETEYRVSGIYGSPLESEWHPAAAYVLRKEMQRFEVLKREFLKIISASRFEFAEMVGGKTVVFVYHLKQLSAFCSGPNAFFVLRK